MIVAIKDVLRDWSIPVVFFLIGMKQYYMTWEVAQLWGGGALVVMTFLYILCNFARACQDIVPKVVLVYFLCVNLLGWMMCLLGSGTLQGVIDISLFPLLFLFFYIKIKTGRISIRSMLVVALVFFPFAVWNSFRWRTMFVDEGALSQQSNAGNFVVALLPFAFLLKNKILRWSFLTLSGASVAVSMKRSGLVLWGMTALYEIFFSKIFKHVVVKRIAIVFFGLIAIGISWGAFSESNAVSRFTVRLSRLIEDGGSGRVSLFFEGWKDWGNRNALEFLIGEGPVGSVDFVLSLVGRYAYHNDIVEILRSSGVLGLIVFVFLWVLLFCKSLVYRKRVPVYGECAFICVLLFIFSMWMFSPVAAFVYYTLPTTALMGGCFAHCFRESVRLQMGNSVSGRIRRVNNEKGA